MPHTHRYPCCRLQSAAASLHRRRPTTPTPECSVPAAPACCRRLQDSIRIPDSGASGVHSAPLPLAPLVWAPLSEAMQGTGAAAAAAPMPGRCTWLVPSWAGAYGSRQSGVRNTARMAACPMARTRRHGVRPRVRCLVALTDAGAQGAAWHARAPRSCSDTLPHLLPQSACYGGR